MHFYKKFYHNNITQNLKFRETRPLSIVIFKYSIKYS